ncbi:MAG: ABC transporter permease [Acidilobaceae archaeon]
MLSEIYVLYMREIKKWAGRRPVLIISLITPLFWILLFGKSFNIINVLSVEGLGVPADIAIVVVGALRSRIAQLFGTLDYFTYVASGMIVVFTLFHSVFSGASVIFDRRLGYMSRLMASPIRRESIFIAKVLATVFRVIILILFLLALSYIAGFKFKQDLSILDLVGALIVVISISVTLTSIFMLLGFLTDSHEFLFAIGNLVNMPLMFSSSALFPIDQMPDWLKAIAKLNPLTYAADLTRYFLVGRHLDEPYIILIILIAGAILTFTICMKVSVKALERT